MPTFISRPTRIDAPGNKPIVIDEYIGRINSGHGQVSVSWFSLIWKIAVVELATKG